MRGLLATAVISATFLAPRLASADLLNNAGIDAHVDAVLAQAAVSSLNPAQKQALLADRLTLNLGVVVPVLGSYLLERKVYGNVRPSAIVFDWILGGFVPAGLAVTGLAGAGAIGSRARAILAWTALGLYGGTRAAILVIGNLHITEYNTRLEMGLSSVPGGGPGLVATASF